MRNNNIVMEAVEANRSREELLAAALRVLEAEGPEGIRARRLAAEIGASTMAVYTHFGGMPGLVDAMVREGLGRFAAHVRRRPRIEDPMADLISGGLAYAQFAFANPELYRLVFGLAGRAAPRATTPPLGVASIWQTPEGEDTFSILLESVERVIEAGDFRRQDAWGAAIQILSTTHGFLLLEMGGLSTDQTQGLIAPLTVNLMVGLGADRRKAERSLNRALEARITR